MASCRPLVEIELLYGRPYRAPCKCGTEGGLIPRGSFGRMRDEASVNRAALGLHANRAAVCQGALRRHAQNGRGLAAGVPGAKRLESSCRAPQSGQHEDPRATKSRHGSRCPSAGCQVLPPLSVLSHARRSASLNDPFPTGLHSAVPTRGRGRIAGRATHLRRPIPGWQHRARRAHS